MSDDFSKFRQEILGKDNIFFFDDFHHAINRATDTKKISIEDFWKLVKIKAKKVSLFVNEIASCQVLEPAPLGFIREITLPNPENAAETLRVKERIVMDEKTKTVLFFQLDTNWKSILVNRQPNTTKDDPFSIFSAQLKLLCAINQVTEEDGQGYFYGYYVYSVHKNSHSPEDQAFMENFRSNQVSSEIVAMIDRMKALAMSKNFDEVYQSFY